MGRKETVHQQTNKYVKAFQAANRAKLDPISQSILSIRDTPSASYSFGESPEFEDDPGLGSRIIDVLSRPLYGAANVGLELTKSIQGDSDANSNPALAFWEGLSGQKKHTFADVVGEAVPESNDQVRAGLGLVGDVLLDPSNLIAGGATKAVRALKKTGPAARPVANAIDETPAISTGRHAIEGEASPAPYVGKHRDDAPEVEVPTGRHRAPEEPTLKTPAVDLDDISPETYDLAVQHVISAKVARPGDIAKITGLSYKDAVRLNHKMEAEGIVGKPFKKETKGGFSSTGGYSVNRPVLVASVDEIPARKIADSSAKIDEAAVVANASAPDTVQALPVENVSRVTSGIPRLDAYDMEQLGVKATSAATKGLKTPEGRYIFTPGRNRAIYLRTKALSQWKSDVEALVAQGAVPKIKASDGTEYVLSTPHALDTLPYEAVEDMLYGAKWAKSHQNVDLYPSQVNAGIAESLRLDDLSVPIGERYARVADAMEAAKHTNAKRAVPRSTVEAAAKTFVDNTLSLRQSQYEAAKAFAKKDLQDASTLAQSASAKVLDSLSDPALSTSQAVGAVTSVGRHAAAEAKAIGASDNAASIGAQQAAEHIAKAVPEADTAAAKAANSVAAIRERLGYSPIANTKVNEALNRALPAIERDSLATASSVGVDTVNISNKIDVTTSGIVQAILHPIRTKFKAGYGMGSFAEVIRSGATYADTAAQYYRAALNQYTKKFTREQQQVAFSALKRGERPVDGVEAEAYDELKQLADAIFDMDDGYLGAFWRTGAGIGEINRALKSKGLGKYQFVHEGRAGDIPNQWTRFDIDDPVDFFDRAHAALTQLAARKAAGMEFSKLGSSVAKPGYVKLDANPDSILGNVIDRSKFYDKETAAMFSRLEHMLNAPRSFRGDTKHPGLAAFITHVIDPFLQLWKPFVTIIRPGHHVRNVMGDGIMTSLDPMINPMLLLTSYKRAMQMMASGGQLQRKGLDGLRELTGELKGGGAIMSTVKLKGRNVQMSYDNGYQLAAKNGLLQTFHRSEDFDEVTGKVVGNIMDSLPLRLAGKLSEKGSHVGRLAHFELLMRTRKFTRQFDSIEAAAESAAQRSRQFHPDSHGLTPFETKYMRRLIPFYSWIRQAFPVVISTMLSKPGRVTVLPKTTYNAAIAAGMDPDSLSDQFPGDKLYPSFVKDTISGPLGDYGYNLGSPQEGILGDILNGNPARNVASMVNPLIKTPIEFTTNQSIGTGAYIADKGEAIDQLLPGVNQAANISGYSPTGTVGNLLSGTPAWDPQRAKARGEKETFFNTSLLNFLTGLGIQDYNKPSYQKIASKELKTQ